MRLTLASVLVDVLCVCVSLCVCIYNLSVAFKDNRIPRATRFLVESRFWGGGREGWEPHGIVFVARIMGRKYIHTYLLTYL